MYEDLRPHFSMLYIFFSKRIRTFIGTIFTEYYIQLFLVASTSGTPEALPDLLGRLGSDSLILQDFNNSPSLSSKYLEALFSSLTQPYPAFLPKLLNLRIYMKDSFNENCVKCIMRLRSDLPIKDKRATLDSIHMSTMSLSNMPSEITPCRDTLEMAQPEFDRFSDVKVPEPPVMASSDKWNSTNSKEEQTEDPVIFESLLPDNSTPPQTEIMQMSRVSGKRETLLRRFVTNLKDRVTGQNEMEAERKESTLTVEIVTSILERDQQAERRETLREQAEVDNLAELVKKGQTIEKGETEITEAVNMWSGSIDAFLKLRADEKKIGPLVKGVLVLRDWKLSRQKGIGSHTVIDSTPLDAVLEINSYNDTSFYYVSQHSPRKQ